MTGAAASSRRLATVDGVGGTDECHPWTGYLELSEGISRQAPLITALGSDATAARNEPTSTKVLAPHLRNTISPRAARRYNSLRLNPEILVASGRRTAMGSTSMPPFSARRSTSVMPMVTVLTVPRHCSASHGHPITAAAIPRVQEYMPVGPFFFAVGQSLCPPTVGSTGGA